MEEVFTGSNILQDKNSVLISGCSLLGALPEHLDIDQGFLLLINDSTRKTLGQTGNWEQKDKRYYFGYENRNDFTFAATIQDNGNQYSFYWSRPLW